MSSRYTSKMVWTEPVTRDWIFQRDKYICHICGLCCSKWAQLEQGERVDNATATLDHVVPIDLGGAHAIWNIATACYGCNTEKANDAAPVDLRTLLDLTKKTTKRYNRERRSLEKQDRLVQGYIDRARENGSRARLYTIDPADYDMPSVFIPDPYKPVTPDPYVKKPKTRKQSKHRRVTYCIIDTKGVCRDGCLEPMFCHGYAR